MKKITRRDFLKGAAGVAAGSALFGLSSYKTPAEAFADNADGKEELYILYTNDVHAALSENIGYIGLMEAKNTLLAAGKKVLLVDCGDYIQGSSAAAMSKGSHIIEIMNLLGYDAATVGNHEFDYSVETLMERVKEANFPIVCCNVIGPDGYNLFEPYTIIESAGRKIAFIGAVTPHTLSSATPKYFEDENGKLIYSFFEGSDSTALAKQLQKNIDSAKNDGADFIIVLSHLGIVPSDAINTFTVIPKLSGVDLWLDGHSHTVMPCEHVRDADGKDVPVSQTGTRLSNIGLAHIAPDGTISTQLVDDSGVSKLLRDITDEINAQLGEKVGHSDYGLYITDENDSTIRLVRSYETNLGDFCADAVKALTGADIAVVNGGGIRVNIPAGDITYNDLFSVLPFANELSVRQVKGSVILDMLELSVHALPQEYGGFLQVSGISFTADTSIPTPVVRDDSGMLEAIIGERRVSEVYVGGEELDPDADYTLASLNFILINHGSGYNMFDDSPIILESGPVDSQAACTYIRDFLDGEIPDDYENPLGDGRIVIA